MCSVTRLARERLFYLRIPPTNFAKLSTLMSTLLKNCSNLQNPELLWMTLSSKLQKMTVQKCLSVEKCADCSLLANKWPVATYPEFRDFISVEVRKRCYAQLDVRPVRMYCERASFRGGFRQRNGRVVFPPLPRSMPFFGEEEETAKWRARRIVRLRLEGEGEGMFSWDGIPPRTITAPPLRT